MPEGDLLIAKKDSGKCVGIIREGLGEVQGDGLSIDLLFNDDIFGEMVYILEQYRSGGGAAGNFDTEQRMIIWRNMAKIPAKRSIDSHQHIYGDEAVAENA
ncbi:cyclic nucleotide-binding domain-containing protein [Flavilitoribacter nigricans]|uniref:Cyclic nucleotide-binding domain-containing protein n=1 Tax=Flavilitoribacter nigricans (strain ATCC 23147 / DSM 23189 / NBRC 102662 / NCIMB 1420 / SS-2) TaxID=1122177 RepID=A0A2D0N6X3_FLAN2|nr:hypothetical protein [Flavilitoribacter nigricans]PHN04217.1 hypothetical protein CRP01_21900 [Flavilitoribacter nigricans DSM 23189 = NBRC 102662]